MNTKREAQKTNEVSHTPTPYRIAEVRGSNGTQWVVGKDNSDTQLYYFNTKEDALMKYIDLVGGDQTIRAVNAHEELLSGIAYVSHLSEFMEGGKYAVAGAAFRKLLANAEVR